MRARLYGEATSHMTACPTCPRSVWCTVGLLHALGRKQKDRVHRTEPVGGRKDEAVRIIDLRKVSLPISRFADPSVPSGGLNTSMLALITDVIRDGKPVIGYGLPRLGASRKAASFASGSRLACSPRARPIFWMKPEPTSTRSVPGGS